MDEQKEEPLKEKNQDRVDEEEKNKTRPRSKSTVMGLKPKIWIFISSSFSIFFNFIFTFAGIVSVNNSSLLSFFKIAYVWIWLGGFLFSLLFGICLIFLTAYDKLNKESRNLVRFYEILILINVASLLIAIIYDFSYFCSGLLINFILDGVLIVLSVLLIFFDYIQWLSLKRHFDSIIVVAEAKAESIKRTQTEISIKNKINDYMRSETELKEVN